MSDPTGFDSAPAHYAGERETIDKQRDLAFKMTRQVLSLGTSAMALILDENKLADFLFMYHCAATGLKYEDREGKKANTDDASKADFYYRMCQHISGQGKDPRSNRPDFKPYERQAK